MRRNYCRTPNTRVMATRESRAEQRKAEVAAVLGNLPSDLGRNRILDAAAASAFWGVSLPHWRRLYRAGKVPHPIKIGERKLGWRIGTLADALEARASAAVA